MSAGNLQDNETIFTLSEMQMRKLNIFTTCIQICTTWSCGFLTSQPTVMKFSQKTENELFNTIWKRFSLKGDNHFCCTTQRTLIGGQGLGGGFLCVWWWVLCLFVCLGGLLVCFCLVDFYWVVGLFVFCLFLVLGLFFCIAVKPITQTIGLFEYFISCHQD